MGSQNAAAAFRYDYLLSLEPQPGMPEILPSMAFVASRSHEDCMSISARTGVASRRWLRRFEAKQVRLWNVPVISLLSG